MFLETWIENLRQLVGQFRVWDLVDLFFVWLIVYRILLLIKQTRAVQMLSGLGILAIIYLTSVWIDLSTINWLLEKFFSNLFVIVVILFQDEIRKALAHIGRNPFFSQVSAVEETQVIEEIVRAAVLFAQKRFGALIVIEREIAVDDFMEMGTRLDSAISVEILDSIFAPSSPLHDGAVIIRGGRLFAAGCFLPLTKNPAIDKNLGTRHRAALGLTDETDAVVIVVSEEKSQIGMAVEGRLQMDLEMSDLRQALYSVFQMKTEGEEKRDRK